VLVRAVDGDALVVAGDDVAAGGAREVGAAAAAVAEAGDRDRLRRPRVVAGRFEA
jgi:hypothetical protein